MNLFMSIFHKIALYQPISKLTSFHVLLVCMKQKLPLTLRRAIKDWETFNVWDRSHNQETEHQSEPRLAEGLLCMLEHEKLLLQVLKRDVILWRRRGQRLSWLTIRSDACTNIIQRHGQKGRQGKDTRCTYTLSLGDSETLASYTMGRLSINNTFFQ